MSRFSFKLYWLGRGQHHAGSCGGKCHCWRLCNWCQSEPHSFVSAGRWRWETALASWSLSSSDPRQAVRSSWLSPRTIRQSFASSQRNTTKLVATAENKCCCEWRRSSSSIGTFSLLFRFSCTIVFINVFLLHSVFKISSCHSEIKPDIVALVTNFSYFCVSLRLWKQQDWLWPWRMWRTQTILVSLSSW